MIGGCDITFKSPHLSEDIIHHAVLAILVIWKNGVIEDANKENGILQPRDLLGGVYKEVFIFKNLAAQESWTKYGWTDGNCKSMIHLLVDFPAKELTCVVEDPKDTETEDILGAIQLVINKP